MRRTTAGGSFTEFVNNYALEFDGVNDYLSGWSFGDFNFIHETGVFTISAWVALTDYTAGGTDFVMATVNTGAARGFSISYSSVSRHYSLLVGRGGENILKVETNVALSDNNYHHILATGNATTGYIYMDGVLQGTDSFGTLGSGNSNALHIGQNSANSGYLPATIDEVAIWNTGMVQSQVDAIYNSGVPNNLQSLPTSGNLVLWLRMGDNPGDAIDGSGSASSANQIVDVTGIAGNATPSAGMSAGNKVAYTP